MAAPSVVVGVDVGTTLTKATVYRTREPIGAATHRTPWTDSPDGREIDAATLFQSTLGVIERAIHDSQTHGSHAIGAIGVASFGESGVLTDENDHPLAPVIAWHDTRGDRQAAALQADVPSFAQRAGRPCDSRPSLIKWRWLTDQGAPVGKAVRWYSVAEWIVAQLGADPASEASLLSRTGVLDVGSGIVDTSLLQWAGADALTIAAPAPAGTSAGTVTRGPRALHGAVASVAGLDCYASAAAMGADDPATAVLSCGTSGALIRVLPTWPSAQRIESAVRHGFTIDRYLDATRPVLLGANPCGLRLQPLMDAHGPPPDDDDPVSQLWNRAVVEFADDEAEQVAALCELEPGLTQIRLVGGWSGYRPLRRALRERIRLPLSTTGGRSTADGAAQLAAHAPS